MSLRKCELSHMGRLKSGRFKLHLRNFNRNARKKNKSWKPAQGLGRVHRLQQQRWAERGAAAPQGKTGLLGGRNPSPEGCAAFSPRAESSTLVLLQLQGTSSSTSSSTSLLQTPPSSLRDLQPDPALPFPHTQPTAGVLSTPPALHGAACAVQPHQRLLEVPTYGEGNCSDSDQAPGGPCPPSPVPGAAEGCAAPGLTLPVTRRLLGAVWIHTRVTMALILKRKAEKCKPR